MALCARNFLVLWNAIGCFITVGIGILISQIIKRKINKANDVIYFAGIKDITLLIFYFSIIVSLSIYLPNLFFN